MRSGRQTNKKQDEPYLRSNYLLVETLFNDDILRHIALRFLTLLDYCFDFILCTFYLGRFAFNANHIARLTTLAALSGHVNGCTRFCSNLINGLRNGQKMQKLATRSNYCAHRTKLRT